MSGRVTIFLTRKNDDATSKDDVISIHRRADICTAFTIKYRPGDGAQTRVFNMSETDTMTYVSSIFKSLDYDTDPFDKVQITTAIHPSIIYDVPALADSDIRYRVEDMILNTLQARIAFVE